MAGGCVAPFRLIAQREQGFLAAGGLAGAGDGEHGVGGEIGRLAGAGGMREGAVVAHVAAELGERDEHLLGEGDARAMTGEAQALGQCGERVEIVADVGQGQSLLTVEQASGFGSGE